MKLVIEPDALLLFLQQKIEQKDAFGLVEGICQLLRKSKPTQILSVLQLLKHTLLQDKALGRPLQNYYAIGYVVYAFILCLLVVVFFLVKVLGEK